MTLTQIVIVVLGVALVLFILIVILLMLFAKAGVNEADPEDDDPLPVQRATFFTGREMAELRSTATPPAVVAGRDLDDAERRIYNQAFADLVISDLDELREIDRTLAGYYLAPEEQR